MEELGRVEVLWMYPQAHRVLGFICKSGLLGLKKSAFKLIQVDALGSNGVLTHSQPEATDAERVKLLESLLLHEVWSDRGNRIGKITDYLFNLRTGAITDYLLVSSGWAGITGEVYQLAPEQIFSFGTNRVLVQEAIVPHLALYRQGLRQKLTEVSEFFQEEVTQEWRSISRRAEEATEETKERWQDLSEQAREQAQRLSQTAKGQAKTLNEQWQEGSQTWAERLREQGQTVAQQLKQKTQQFSRQVEDRIETIVVQAEEMLDPETRESQKPPTAPPQSPPPVQPNSHVQSHPPAATDNSEKANKDNDDDDDPWI